MFALLPCSPKSQELSVVRTLETSLPRAQRLSVKYD
jgi:hypothetical protein